ncbi:MAG TPA: class I SAM-dependent methyltransferase [Tepidisphaeraceae bacterium]|nr:class I SAM-dependent methyltransferase [Tepidisphaeraceae bacterium]
MNANANALNSASTFETWALDYYEPAALKHYDQMIDWMLKQLHPPPGATVFDAGCGTGVHSIRTAKAGFAVQAMDISHIALEIARRKAAEEGVASKVTFGQGDVTQLPFPDGCFDTLFCWGVLSHIPNVDSAMRELVRVVKPGGRLAIQTVNGRALDHRIENTVRFLFRKPIPGLTRTRYGAGSWCDMDGGKLFNWRFKLNAISQAFADLGCKQIARRASELTEFQRQIGGPPRWFFRKANDLWAALNLPAGPAITNILVFEKKA